MTKHEKVIGGMVLLLAMLASIPGGIYAQVTMTCSDMPSHCRPYPRGCMAISIDPFYELCYFECSGIEVITQVWCIDDN